MAGFGQGKPLVDPRESGIPDKGVPHNCPEVILEVLDSDMRRPHALQVVGKHWRHRLKRPDSGAKRGAMPRLDVAVVLESNGALGPPKPQDAIEPLT